MPEATDNATPAKPATARLQRRLERALDSEIAAFNADHTGDAAFWRACFRQQVAETHRLRALLLARGVQPDSAEVVAAVEALVKRARGDA